MYCYPSLAGPVSGGGITRRFTGPEGPERVNHG